MDKVLKRLIDILRTSFPTNGYDFQFIVEEPYVPMFIEVTSGILYVVEANALLLRLPPSHIFTISTSGLDMPKAIEALENRYAQLFSIPKEPILHAQSMREVARGVCVTNHAKALKLILEKVNEEALGGHTSLFIRVQGDRLIAINHTLIEPNIVIMIKDLLSELQTHGYKTLLDRTLSGEVCTYYWVRWE